MSVRLDLSNPLFHHNLCAWTFHPGKGGFHPGDIRPELAGMDSPDKVEYIHRRIKPLLPGLKGLGFEVHYDGEVNQRNASSLVRSLKDADMHLAMITPGAHAHCAHGGIASLDEKERRLARRLGTETVDLAYGTLRPAWNKERSPTLVLWNGSWGYDLQGPQVPEMLNHLKRSIGDLSDYEFKLGGKLYMGIEPKPNEGHPSMLLGNMSDGLALWQAIFEERKYTPRQRKMRGMNEETGHAQMNGSDPVQNMALQYLHPKWKPFIHYHANSQGGSDGIHRGGPGEFDIDFGVLVDGTTISLARQMLDQGYNRSIGHDFQTRAGDKIKMFDRRVAASVVALEACGQVAKAFPMKQYMAALAERDTIEAGIIIGDAIDTGRKMLKEWYASVPDLEARR